MTDAEPTRQTVELAIDQSLQLAVARHQAGQWQEAEELYRAILQVRPDHPEANHNMGVLQGQTRHPAAGLPYFLAALEADSARRQYWLSYIDALIQAGQTQDARQMLALARQQGLQADEVTALALRLEAASQGEDQAEADHQDAIHRPPTGASPDLQEINALVALFTAGRLEAAASLAQQMTVRFPAHEFGWKALGAAFKQLGRSADALAPMQEAAALSPDNAEAHSNLGAILTDLGRLDEAETSYRRALRIAPDLAAAHYNLGITLKELGRPREAEASFRQVLQSNPDNAEAHNNLGVTLHELGRMAAAEGSYRQALAISPDYAEAHNNLGNVLQGLGRLDEAEASFRRALAINVDFALALNNLGQTLKDMGRLDQAEASCRRALQISPDLATAQGLLDDIHRQQGLLPDYLAPEVFDFANGRLLRRYAPREAAGYIYSIDVSGTCNLRCPTCPVGNLPDANRPKGFMELDLFRRIVERIKRDRVGDNPRIWLFNWGEPMLHPKLPEMIALLRSNKLYAVISTNLNIRKNVTEVIRAGPDEIKISLSGFTQGFYSRTHTKGNIELVKQNMHLLRDLIDQFKVPTRVWVGHHLYRHNSHESAAIRNLCATLDFDYNPVPAFYQPLEKMVNLIEGRVAANEAGLLANLPVHPLETLARKKEFLNPDLDCELRFNMTTINYDGSVALCCGCTTIKTCWGSIFLMHRTMKSRR